MKVTLFVLIMLTFGVETHAAPLTAESLVRVRAASFEVVVRKPSEQGIEYERPLPLELLPFSERSDRFWSVGTAFAIAPGTYVSAGHVITAAMGGQGGTPLLRDASGKIYEIDRVLKYSMHQDFVVFTTSNAPASAVLETSANAALDQPVHAVGNALGEGVVIRDGVLTSRTPEEQDGRWQWLRFSAATSPGNSGGPLLDADGKVIGVVIGKSPAENLNYALPIGEVLTAGETARVDTRFAFRLPVVRDSIVANYRATFPLPLPLSEFARRRDTADVDFYRTQRAALLTKAAGEMFPRGKSAKLLSRVPRTPCGALVHQDENKTWELDGEDYESETRFPDGSSACVQRSTLVTMFHLARAPGSSDDKFYDDSSAAMDFLLKELKLPRAVAGDEVIITSLGTAASDTEYRDRFARSWRLRDWPLPFVDSHIVGLFLPTPDGYVGMLQFAQRGELAMTQEQIKFLADYFLVSYRGTMPQWQAFLARRDLRPGAVDGTTVSSEATTGFHYRSRRLELDVPLTLMKLTNESTIQMQMAFMADTGVLGLDVASVYVNQDVERKTFVGAIRHSKPADATDHELHDYWSRMIQRTGEYADERGHDSDWKKYWRRTSVGAGYISGAPLDPDAKVLYEVVSMTQDVKTPRQIDDMQGKLIENVRVLER